MEPQKGVNNMSKTAVFILRLIKAAGIFIGEFVLLFLFWFILTLILTLISPDTGQALDRFSQSDSGPKNIIGGILFVGMVSFAWTLAGGKKRHPLVRKGWLVRTYSGHSPIGWRGPGWARERGLSGQHLVCVLRDTEGLFDADPRGQMEEEIMGDVQDISKVEFIRGEIEGAPNCVTIDGRDFRRNLELGGETIYLCEKPSEMKQCERCGADMGAKVRAWIDADTGQSKQVCKDCFEEVTGIAHAKSQRRLLIGLIVLLALLAVIIIAVLIS